MRWSNIIKARGSHSSDGDRKGESTFVYAHARARMCVCVCFYVWATGRVIRPVETAEFKNGKRRDARSQEQNEPCERDYGALRRAAAILERGYESRFIKARGATLCVRRDIKSAGNIKTHFARARGMSSRSIASSRVGAVFVVATIREYSTMNTQARFFSLFIIDCKGTGVQLLSIMRCKTTLSKLIRDNVVGNLMIIFRRDTQTMIKHARALRFTRDPPRWVFSHDINRTV